MLTLKTHRPTESRQQRGLNRFLEINQEGGRQLLATLGEVAPDLARFVAEWAYCDVFCREGMDLQRRELVTIGTLAALGGCEPQLKLHVNSALNVGLDAPAIVEAILQCLPYIGFPRAINAMMVAKQVFAERGLAPQ
jgi:4-carboxymuconolactone decarboxylase